jgi:hypothetical protein
MNYEYNSFENGMAAERMMHQSQGLPPEAAAALPFVIGGVTILAIIFYVYTAYCQYVIAKKTNTENAWMAWVPFLNMWQMVKIARKEWWYFLLMFIPLVNIVVFVILWMKIAEIRNMPSWLGILMIISPVNLIVLGFLAFKDAPLPAVVTPPMPPMTPPANMA